ncbi:hypothetical protein [Kaarinaea lacus]
MYNLKGNFILFFVLLLMSNVSLSQPLYITDKIPIPVYSEANKNSPLVKKLPSGTLVISRPDTSKTDATTASNSLANQSKFVEIETSDGISGWIESIYLTNEKPTQIEYLQLANKYKEAEAKIQDYETRLLELQELRKEAKTVDWLRNQLNANKKREAAFEQEIKLKDIALAESKITVASLEEQLSGFKPDTENQNSASANKQQTLQGSYVDDIGSYANSSSIRFYTWLVLSLAVTLIIGILLGFVLLDYKARKKSGFAKEI